MDSWSQKSFDRLYQWVNVFTLVLLTSSSFYTSIACGRFTTRHDVDCNYLLLVWTNDFVQIIAVAILSFGQDFATLFLRQSLPNQIEIWPQ